MDNCWTCAGLLLFRSIWAQNLFNEHKCLQCASKHEDPILAGSIQQEQIYQPIQLMRQELLAEETTRKSMFKWGNGACIVRCHIRKGRVHGPKFLKYDYLHHVFSLACCMRPPPAFDSFFAYFSSAIGFDFHFLVLSLWFLVMTVWSKGWRTRAHLLEFWRPEILDWKQFVCTEFSLGVLNYASLIVSN